MRFECRPIFVVCIFSIPLPKAYLVSTCFLKNVVSQVYILLIGARTEICGNNISQLLYDVEKSINWCIDIISHLFNHILTLGKHLRCDSTVGIEEILDNGVYGLIDGVGIAIMKVSDVLRVNVCDDFQP